MRVYPKPEPGNITAGQDGKPLVLSDTTLLGELAAIERQGIIDRLNSGRELYIQKGGRLERKPEAGKRPNRGKRNTGRRSPC